jgi:hypothetical protein
MKGSKVLIVLFSTFVIPTLVLSNASKANACHPLNPFCQTKEILQMPPSRAEIESQARKELAEEEARNRAKADAERRRQEEINRVTQAENERIAEEERAAIENARAEEKVERANRTSTERAELIIKTIRDRSDVRNINLQTDSERKLTGVCYEQKELAHTQVSRDNANHPSAYNDGYREGRTNAQRGEKYVPRTGGGEFSRGFDDGYYGKKSTGQDPSMTVNDSSQPIYLWNKKCADV